MGEIVYNDLVQQIRARRMLLVVGAGVSVQATGNNPVASWIGLLRDGVARISGLNRVPSPGWAERQTAVLDAVAEGKAKTGELLGVAQQVSEELGWQCDVEWDLWLRDTVGALTPTPDGRRLLNALAALDIPIATTNYDGLLEAATGLPAISWPETGAIVRMLRKEDKGVLHLHGFWKRPDDVILGISSYEALISKDTAQRLKEMLPSLYGLLYVGCGAGLTDPNFAKLRAWIRDVMFETEHRHVRLALEDEVAHLQKEHPPEERTFLLGYGSTFEHLAPYLEQLARDAGRPPITSRRTAATARKLTLSEVAEECTYADDRYASCYIHAPQGTPEGKLEVKFGATFGRLLPAKAPPLIRVEVEVAMPKGRAADRMLGGSVAYQCADGPSIQLSVAKSARPCWEVAAPDGQSLHGHRAEASEPPLFEIPGAVEGDRLTMRMQAHPNKAFFEGPWRGAAVPKGDKAKTMRERIIDRLQVTPLGEPDEHGAIVFCETTNIVEEQG